NASMMPCSWLVSRRLAETVGPWNEALSLDDDGEYQCRLAAASDEVRFVGGATAYYRVGNVRSLSWQTSRKALASQWRSMQLCMGHLLALEDSDRTRQACMTYLQDNLTLFYPDAHDIVAQMRERAAALGGELQPPAQGRLFSLTRRAIGWSNAKALRMLLGRQSTRLRSLVQP
ncbi:MAG TPA: hypothetical protein VLA16_18485, partial [Ideonella sp.]|nr:hypothetical protein [Ideonella sp.]